MNFSKYLNEKLVPYILSFFFLIIYLFSINSNLTYDSINYAYDISERVLKYQLHPHHLLFSVIFSIILKPFNTLLNLDDKLLFLQIINCLIASGILIVFYKILDKISISKVISFLLILICGFSYAFTKYSHQIEVYLITILFISLATINLLEFDKLSIFKKALTIIYIVLSLSFHQTAIFSLIGFAYYINKNFRSEKNKFIFLTVILPIIIISLLYISAVYIQFGSFNFTRFYRFVTSYAHSGIWGSFELSNFHNSILGFLSIFFYCVPLYIFLIKYFTTFQIIIFLAVIIAFFIYLLLKQKLIKPTLIRNNNFISIAIPTIMAQSIFIWYWEPMNVEFWMTLITSIVIVFGIIFSKLNKKYAHYLLFYLLILELIVFAFNTNFNLTKHNYYKEYAKDVSKLTNKNDFIICAGNDLVSYLIYYSDAKVVDLVFLERKFSKTNFVFKSTEDSLKKVFNLAKQRNGKIYFEKQVIENSDMDSENYFKYKFLNFLSSEIFIEWIKELKFKKIYSKNSYLYLLELN